MPSILKCRILEARNIFRKEIQISSKTSEAKLNDSLFLGVPIYCEVRLGNTLPESSQFLNSEGIGKTEVFNTPNNSFSVERQFIFETMDDDIF